MTQLGVYINLLFQSGGCTYMYIVPGLQIAYIKFRIHTEFIHYTCGIICENKAHTL